MNNVIKAAVISLPLALGTAYADDSTAPLDMTGGLDVAPMVDTDLATIYGGYKGYGRKHGYYKHYDFSNYAEVTQVNLSNYSAFVDQKNTAYVTQSNH